MIWALFELKAKPGVAREHVLSMSGLEQEITRWFVAAKVKIFSFAVIYLVGAKGACAWSWPII